MGKLNVAVLFGGVSPEHDVSKASASTVISNMSSESYNIIPVYISKDGTWFLYDGNLNNINVIEFEKIGTPTILSPDRNHKGLLRLANNKYKIIPVDVLFPVLHGKNGEDGTVQGLFELSGIPYVGCDVLSSSICMDKHYTKLVVNTLGILQSPYLTFSKDDYVNSEDILKKIRYEISYPYFVKPANAGSSIGISKVNNKKELVKAINLALAIDSKFIVEKAIVGRELECAVLGSCENNMEVSIVGEIISADNFYDFESKYNNPQSQTIAPAEISDEISEEIRNASAKIFKALGCRGLSRVDFFLENETNKVIFNEINTLPGFTNISMYPMLWERMGVPISTLLDRLINIALSH